MGLTASFSTVDELNNWAINWLRRQGFTVTITDTRPLETVAELCRRLDFNVTSFSRTLQRADHPPVHLIRGPSGRIIKVRSTPEFDAWLTASRNPKRRRAQAPA